MRTSSTSTIGSRSAQLSSCSRQVAGHLDPTRLDAPTLNCSRRCSSTRIESAAESNARRWRHASAPGGGGGRRAVARPHVETITYHDDVSTTQNENLERIVAYHNSQGRRDLDISVHFNAYTETESPMGTEVLYVTQGDLASDLSSTIASVSGLIDRGGKKRDDVYFLNNTDEPSVLIETCFVDSDADVKAYGSFFDRICWAIAGVVGGAQAPEKPKALVNVSGSCSWFGGPEDIGVRPDEGLAFFYEMMTPHICSWLSSPRARPGWLDGSIQRGLTWPAAGITQ